MPKITPSSVANLDDDERRLWFAAFSYRGDALEAMKLRDGLGTFLAAEIWDIVKALRNLRQHDESLFQRFCGAAIGDRKPFDPDAVLRDPRFGPLTYGDGRRKGEWQPGRREIIAALTQYDSDDISVIMSHTPFADENSGVRKAA